MNGGPGAIHSGGLRAYDVPDTLDGAHECLGNGDSCHCIIQAPLMDMKYHFGHDSDSRLP